MVKNLPITGSLGCEEGKVLEFFEKNATMKPSKVAKVVMCWDVNQYEEVLREKASLTQEYENRVQVEGFAVDDPQVEVIIFRICVRVRVGLDPQVEVILSILCLAFRPRTELHNITASSTSTIGYSSQDDPALGVPNTYIPARNSCNTPPDFKD